MLDGNDKVTISLVVADSDDSLHFLLNLSHPLLPHLSFHVVIGIVLIHSEEELKQYSQYFDKLMCETLPQCSTCLFAFTNTNYDETKLSASVTQIVTKWPSHIISRRFRESFFRVIMDFYLKFRTTRDSLNETKEQSLLLLGSYNYLFGRLEEASKCFSQCFKSKANNSILSMVFDLTMSNGLKIDIDKSFHEKDINLSKEDLSKLPTEQISALSYAHKSNDKQLFIIQLLRTSYFYLHSSRPLILLALQNLKGGNIKKSSFYINISLLILKLGQNLRTFMFQCDRKIEEGTILPIFVVKEYINCIIDGIDWCELRILPASKLLISNYIPRDVKNQLFKYIIAHINKIKNREQQITILSIIPSNMIIEASQLIEIKEIKLQTFNEPIIKSNNESSNIFIYSPLKKENINNICALDDYLSFVVTLRNKLLTPLKFDIICLNATNSITYPIVKTLPYQKIVTFPLILKANKIDEIIVKGFTFVSKQISGEYVLPNPIKIQVVKKLPKLSIKQLNKINNEIIYNSNINMNFEIINTSDVMINIKRIKFASRPPLYTKTSLPITYPPLISNDLPENLLPGNSFKFSLRFIADFSFNVLSFAIEYGNDEYIRRFEFNQEFNILNGPFIKEIRGISLDDFDDFENNLMNLLIIISNPLNVPIYVENMLNNEKIIVEPLNLGSFILQVKRSMIKIDKNMEKFQYEDIGREHVRRCEALATSEKGSPLTNAELHDLWLALALKFDLQKHIKLQWFTQADTRGPLPFTHVEIKRETLMFLQAPPFKVKFRVEKAKRINVWIVICKIKCKEKVELNASIIYNVLNEKGEKVRIMTAGEETKRVVAPEEFKQIIHSIDGKELNIVGHFNIGNITFTRLGKFALE